MTAELADRLEELFPDGVLDDTRAQTVADAITALRTQPEPAEPEPDDNEGRRRWAQPLWVTAAAATTLFGLTGLWTWATVELPPRVSTAWLLTAYTFALTTAAIRYHTRTGDDD